MARRRAGYGTVMPNRTAAVITTLALTTAVAPLPLAGAATSDATFKKKANAACRSAGAKVRKLPDLTKENTAEVLLEEVGIVEALVKKLKAIDPPKGKTTKYKSFISATQKQATLAEQAVETAKAQDTDKAESLLKQAAKAGERSDALAKQLKLSDCAKRYSANA